MSTAAPDTTAGLPDDMTDEQKAFLNFDETDLKDEDAPAQNAAYPAPGTDADAGDGKPAADPADPAAVVAPDAAAVPAVAEPAAEPAATAPPEPVVPAAAAPLLNITAPADAKEQLDKISADKATLAEKFDAGDLTGAEFQRELDALNRDERKIETAVNNAELAAQMQQAQAKQVWVEQCETFMTTAAGKVYGADKALMAQFDETVKAIAVMPRNRGLTGDALLMKAHNMLQAELGNPVVAPPVVATPPTKPLPKPRDPLPPTLQNLPAADVTDTTGGQYAHLDRLASNDPAAYEAAMAKMSDGERDAYMKVG